MSDPNLLTTVSVLIRDMKGGDPAAIAAICNRYLTRLTRVAQRKLSPSMRAVCDGEDLALETLETMRRAASQGKLKRVNNRGDLWSMLVSRVSTRAAEVCRRERRLKRGGAFKRQPLEEIESPAQPIDFELMLVEEQSRFLALLRNDELREVARLTLAGETVEKISKQLRILPRSVRRKQSMICEQWSKEAEREV